MKNSLHQHLQIAIHLAILAVVLSLGAFVSYQKEKNAIGLLTERVHVQEENMRALAEVTDRNGADASTESIIKDCPRRTEYESHLVRLGTLSKQELVVMQTLFESCGSFYAERKALMISKLERELTAYHEYLRILSLLTDITDISKQSDIFEEIVALERMRSDLLQDQSTLQEKIISLLISGKSAQGEDVSNLLREAQNVSDLLTLHDQKIDALRESVSVQ